VLSKVSSKNSSGSKCFRSLAFSADGTALLAGGNSKFVCLYGLAERTLLRKYVLSNNAALDGVRMHLNSSHLTSAGPVQDILLDSDEDDATAGAPRTLARRSERVTKLAIRCACVRFSPDGRSWAAASTEGLLIFSLDDARTFDPTGLEMLTTPDAIVAAVGAGDFGRALPMALCLGEPALIRGSWAMVPPDQIAIVAAQVRSPFTPPFTPRFTRPFTPPMHTPIHTRVSHLIHAHTRAPIHT
jgi:periodic tryptophan protein 2